MNTLRPVSLVLSLLLHAAAGTVLVASVSIPLHKQEVLTLDLTRIELSTPPAHEKKSPPPLQARPQTHEGAPRAINKPHPPQPFTQQAHAMQGSQKRTAPQPTAPPSSPPTPSPVDPAEPTPAPRKEPEHDKAGRRIIRVGSSDGLAHRGHEARFGRSLLADFYSYSADEFAGTFSTSKGRTISIIDARKTEYGRFLIYDSKTGLLRRLKQFNKYIYTIGPSLTEDEPVTGSVTFLAKDDRIERFIYMPQNEKAFFPGKIHFAEESLSVPCQGVRLKATLTLSDRASSPAAVLVHGAGCIPLDAMQGASRALAMKGVASAAFVPRGCAYGKAPLDGGLALDAYSTLLLLQRHNAFNLGNTGYIGIDGGYAAALRAATKGGAAFLVVAFTAPKAPQTLPALEQLAQITAPSLWIFPQHGVGYETIWNTVMQYAQSTKRITIRSSSRNNMQPVGDSDKAGSWVLRFAAADAATAADWICALPQDKASFLRPD